MFLKRLSKWTITAVFIIVLALVAAGCSSDSDEQGSVPKTGNNGSNGQAAEVNVNMTDFAFQPQAASTPAGKITFHVKNTGGAVHEMVVIKTDLDANQLPKKEDQTVDESKLESIGEVEVETGGSKDLSVDLAPGHYVLLCNEPGHYAQGMATNFTVE